MNQDRAFSFIPLNARSAKPRQRGLTEIRGPYYSVMGERDLADVLDTMGWYVDDVKFAGGSFALMHRHRVKALIDLAHAHDVYVSTGGWILPADPNGRCWNALIYLWNSRPRPPLVHRWRPQRWRRYRPT